MSNLPYEVWWASFILARGQPVGREVHEKVSEIIVKYPQHFPWEHKYASIPKEVHEAYKNEAYPPIENLENTNTGNGILNQIENNPPTEYKVLTIEMLNEVFDSLNKHAKKQKALEDKRKVIWDKHYKKYKLPYRNYFNK